MGNPPQISIIVPVYNVERYLRQCIGSILKQSFSDFELLLIDDGSTDKSGEICDEYAASDERIHVVHKENTGQADCRNIALELARGELIGFVDSDDWIEPDMYDTLYHTLLENKADIAICGYFQDYKNRACISCSDGQTTLYAQDEALRLILEDKTIKSFLWDKLFRRHVITEPLPSSYYYEDYATLFKWFAVAESVVFCHKPFYHYRQRRGSTDHDKDPQKKYHFFWAERERYRYLSEHALLPAEQLTEFAVNVVRIGLQETKEIARFSNQHKQCWHYIQAIRTELRPYLPVECRRLGLKRFIRLWELRHFPMLYVFLRRLGRLSLFPHKNKRYEYYE